MKKRLRAMGIRDKPTAPRSPWQNAYAERLIGSILRDCVDHYIVFNETYPRHIMRSYAKYYNELRMLQTLGKDSPLSKEIQREGRIESVPLLGGLHHHCVWVKFLVCKAIIIEAFHPDIQIFL